MSTEYKINNGTKWGMITLALLFDGIQFITPGFTDTLITAMAAMVFGMIFIEKGALTVGGTTALRYARLLAIIAEVIFGNIPTITLTALIQIKISRAVDTLPGEKIKDLIGRGRLVGDYKDVRKQWKTVKHRTKQISKYAYGKGRRGASTLARKAGGNARLQAKMLGRTTAQKQRVLSTAKNYSKNIKKST